MPCEMLIVGVAYGGLTVEVVLGISPLCPKHSNNKIPSWYFIWILKIKSNIKYIF